MQVYAQNKSGVQVSESDQIEYNKWFASTVSTSTRVLLEEKHNKCNNNIARVCFIEFIGVIIRLGQNTIQIISIDPRLRLRGVFQDLWSTCITLESGPSECRLFASQPAR